MTYIENIFICMASPLLIAALCMGKRQTKFFLFCLAGTMLRKNPIGLPGSTAGQRQITE